MQETMILSSLIFQFYKVRLKPNKRIAAELEKAFQFYKVRLKRTKSKSYYFDTIISILQSSIKT